MSSVQGAHRRFCVVARVKAGAHEAKITNNIAISIGERLRNFLPNVSFTCKDPNIIIKMCSAAFQMELLGIRELAIEDGFVLEFLPWCPEYVTADLPWISSYTAEICTPGPSKPYMDNLASQPEALMNCVLGILTGEVAGCFKQAETADITPGVALAKNRLYIDSLCGLPGTPLILDYSHMMILKLRDFYHQKYRALVQCRLLYKDIYDITDNVRVRLGPVIETVYGYTKDFRGTSIAASGDRLQSGALGAAEKLEGIQNILRAAYQKVSEPLSLSRFKGGPSVYQEDATDCPTAHLRTILNLIAKWIHKGEVSVETTPGADGNFCTFIDQGTITGVSCKRVAAKSLFEAEATAICQFIRPVTHELGYSIVDQNYHVLARLMFEINWYNEHIGQLEDCADQAASVVRQARENVKALRDLLPRKIEVWHKKPVRELSALVGGLLSSVKRQRKEMKKALEAFKLGEEAYWAVKL